MPAKNRKIPSVNLLPTDEGDQNLVSRIIRWILGTFRVLVISVELLVIVGFLSRFYLDSRNSDLTDEMNQKKALLESYLPFENDFKTAQKRLSVFQTFAYSQPQLSEYLTQLTKHLPGDLQLTRISRNGKEVSILVVGRNESSISAYAAAVRKEPLLETVAVVSIEGVPNSTLIQATLKTQTPTQPTNEEQPS